MHITAQVKTPESSLKTEAGQCSRDSERCYLWHGMNASVNHIKLETQAEITTLRGETIKY